MQIPLFTPEFEHIHGIVSGTKHSVLCGFVDEVEYISTALEQYIKNPTIHWKLTSCEEIWIKPNLTSDSNPSRGKTSQPKVLHELLSCLIKHGIPPNKIKVADSSVIGINTKVAACETGILDICKNLDVEFLDLRDVGFEDVPVERHRIFQRLPVNVPFLNKRNFLINLAKIKSTYGSPVGFSIKNNKGAITDDFKLNFHLLGVQDGLCDLFQVISWDLTILEGFPVSELGLPSWSGLFAISTSSILADVCVAQLCKVQISDVPHLHNISEDVGLQVIGTFSPRLQRAVPKLLFSKVGISEIEQKFDIKIEGASVCSGCRESFFRALTKINKDGHVKKGTYFLGACAHSDYPVVEGAKHVIGNCAIRSLDAYLANAEDPEHAYLSSLQCNKISGCPPTIDGMTKSLCTEKLDSNARFTSAATIEGSFDIPTLQVAVDSKIHSDIVSLVPKEKIDFSDFGLERALACEVVCAAICHQINWDFLREKIYTFTANNPEAWAPENLIKFGKKDIHGMLGEYSKPHRIRPKERSRLINNLSLMFADEIRTYKEIFFWGDSFRPDFMHILTKAEAFSSDPSSKKLQVLIHTLSHLGITSEIDKFAQPAIDYHIMRLYLRRGDVSYVNISGEKYLTEMKRRKVKTILSLRQKVSEALEYMAKLSNLPIPLVNTIEWWVGRSVCKKLHPDCLLESPEGEWLRPTFTTCPFITTCFGYNCNKELLKVHEPFYAGNLY